MYIIGVLIISKVKIGIDNYLKNSIKVTLLRVIVVRNDSKYLMSIYQRAITITMKQLYYIESINRQINHMSMSEQAKIIDIAENIFQNVGIRRWIDQIQSLRNYQIYSEICKIIFPETMIRLIQISESQKTTGEKIQEVINIISRNFRLDLNHISGVAIAQGNLVSLRYWLELLSAISNTFIPTTSREDAVHTAPENNTTDQYSNTSDTRFNTAIGVSGEFRNRAVYSTNSDDDEDQTTKSLSKSLKSQHLNPVGDKHLDKQKNIKKVGFVDIPQKSKPKNKNKFNKTSSTKFTQSYTKTKNTNTTIGFYAVSQRKIQYVKKVHKIMEELQKKKMYDCKNNYAQWEKDQNNKQKTIVYGVQNAAKLRNQYINNKIMQREEIVKQLRGEDRALKSIIGMFKQERKYYKEKEKETNKQMKEEVQDIINSLEADEAMLEQAFRKTLTSY